MRLSSRFPAWFHAGLFRRTAFGTLLLAAAGFCAAQVRPLAQWKGYAGAGAIAFPKYTGGRASETVAAPLLMFEYKETLYVDLVRAGVRLWSNADRTLALGIAAESRFGFRASDGARLAGMAARRHSIELGPSLEWETPLVSVSLAWVGDVSRASRGTALRAAAYRQVLDTGRWDLGAYAGVDRAGAKVVNYYFGVSADEATGARPAYQPGAATHWTMGLSAACKLDERHVVLFGLQGTRLGSSAGASPITAARNAAVA